MHRNPRNLDSSDLLRFFKRIHGETGLKDWTEFTCNLLKAAILHLACKNVLYIFLITIYAFLLFLRQLANLNKLQAECVQALTDDVILTKNA
jgi:hypothetical protein